MTFTLHIIWNLEDEPSEQNSDEDDESSEEFDSEDESDSDNEFDDSICPPGCDQVGSYYSLSFRLTLTHFW